MKVVYTAPNRGHHYRYASALHKEGMLYKFVSGFSRFSPRAPFPEIGNKLVRADILQNIYLASLKFGAPKFMSDALAYWAKKEQDRVSSRYLKDADVFVFYNGSGLYSCKKSKGKKVITVAEAVNSHVDYQERLLKEEHLNYNLPWTPFNVEEKKRRIQEYELADYILLPSEFVKKSFLEYGFPEDKLLKVPFGFNQLPAEAALGIKEANADAEFTILYVGSVSVRKGLRYLIEAFNEFNHPNKKLVIVGPKAKVTGLEGIIIPEGATFTGTLKGDELEKAYKSADVFCLPSIEEGLALVLGEAMSYGLPIIATENTGATDIIEDGKDGFIVPIRDSKAISNKLTNLAENKELYRTIKDNAINKAKTLNGWDETGNLLCTTLRRIVNQ
ncbi:glycosyltransferase family 4 protein [Flavobacterium zepuense]|uniref:Glycosyltransferase family 4 protein n=1 Tax=Flavobacterium zepuense TaxID=2593302 RepID=A0A552V2E9_9FLAO|nr:glycosyltransferase family 4 protein [Flavobacterium zepuense]TRW24635.1 glycosyltransferase family 4 protein [Flavobacterium zepuense]